MCCLGVRNGEEESEGESFVNMSVCSEGYMTVPLLPGDGWCLSTHSRFVPGMKVNYWTCNDWVTYIHPSIHPSIHPFPFIRSLLLTRFIFIRKLRGGNMGEDEKQQPTAAASRRWWWWWRGDAWDQCWFIPPQTMLLKRLHPHRTTDPCCWCLLSLNGSSLTRHTNGRSAVKDA